MASQRTSKHRNSFLNRPKKKPRKLRDDASEVEKFLHPFSTQFTAPTYLSACLLLVGAILSLNRRTVSCARSALDWAGMDYCRMHRVMSMAAWSPLACSKILLVLLVDAFVPEGLVLIGVDETIERRSGPKIEGLGVYRDAVRSSKGFFVKCKGKRWMCFMLLVRMPWLANRAMALPFMTLACPSERADLKANRRHRGSSEQAGRALAAISRWLPGRQILLVGDGGFGCLRLFDKARHLSARRPGARVDVLARARSDARIFDEPQAGAGTPKVGRPRVVGARQAYLGARREDPGQAWTSSAIPGWLGADGRPRSARWLSGTGLWWARSIACPIRWAVSIPQGSGPKSNPAYLACSWVGMDPRMMISAFSMRWQIEVAFEDMRRHVGLQTQRQWSKLAVQRTTPALMGLYSLVVLWASRIWLAQGGSEARSSDFYKKSQASFSDMIACVRKRLWKQESVQSMVEMERILRNSRRKPQSAKNKPPPRPLSERLAELVCWPA